MTKNKIWLKIWLMPSLLWLCFSWLNEKLKLVAYKFKGALTYNDTKMKILAHEIYIL